MGDTNSSEEALLWLSCQRASPGRDGLHLRHVAVTVQRDIGASRNDRLGALPHRAAQRRHREIITHQEAIEADVPSNDIPMHGDGS